MAETVHLFLKSNGRPIHAMIVAPALNRLLKWRIDTKLARMAPDLKKARGSKKGLLVVVEVKESERHDENGMRVKDVHEILIGPAGNDEGEAYRSFMMHGYMHSGPPKGWRLSPLYIWVTAP
jgi:hypothetical protein